MKPWNRVLWGVCFVGGLPGRPRARARDHRPHRRPPPMTDRTPVSGGEEDIAYKIVLRYSATNGLDTTVKRVAMAEEIEGAILAASRAGAQETERLRGALTKYLAASDGLVCTNLHRDVGFHTLGCRCGCVFCNSRTDARDELRAALAERAPGPVRGDGRVGNGHEPRGCPTPGACSCLPLTAAERRVVEAAMAWAGTAATWDGWYEANANAAERLLWDTVTRYLTARATAAAEGGAEG